MTVYGLLLGVAHRACAMVLGSRRRWRARRALRASPAARGAEAAACLTSGRGVAGSRGDMGQ